jgi:hypothetical protein
MDSKELPEGWEKHFRDDMGQWEAICPHGVGHYITGKNRTHGCDGCCSELKL